MKFGIGLIATFAVGTASAHAACVTPSSIALLGEDIAGSPIVAAQPFSFLGRELQWVTVSWEGPEDGRLFVVDCDGRQLASLKGDFGKENLGYAKEMKLGPLVYGKPTLTVSYVPGSGTNIRELAAAVIRFDGLSISTLWSHRTFNGIYPPASLGPEDELQYSWPFRNGFSRIEVRSTETTGYNNFNTRPLPVENYCLRRDLIKYVACQYSSLVRTFPLGLYFNMLIYIKKALKFKENVAIYWLQ